jgi:hypothetical protein
VFGVTESSDYHEYVSLAQYINGDMNAEVRPHRFLKPLNPLLVAGLAHNMNYETAFIVQALFFYVALIVMMFFFAKEFFDDVFLSTLIALYVALCYPILRYGVDILTETGALFFYVASIYLTLRYLKTPAWRFLLLNTATITIGFLWKEYVVVSAIIFGLAILFHSSLTAQEKMQHFAAYAALFLAVHIPLQIYVYLHYNFSYLSWYSIGVHGAIQQNEFTVRNIIKSTAVLLGLMWLVVPIGLMKYASLAPFQRRFWQVGILPPFIGYAWGYISSRLLFVMAPPFLLVAGMGMRGWSKTAQAALVGLAICANIAWLIIAYHVKF